MATPIQVIDDDDEFDWDAAVREIDVACSINATTTKPSQPQPPPPIEDANNNGNCQKLKENQPKSRQSTLDRFINKDEHSKPYSENPVNNDEVVVEDEKPEVSERVCYVDIDPEAAKTWVYPDNVPRREYQLDISRTALFSNTLVALPTGLGKTLIAAVVMYNYFRWFPEGKIVFAAPSRPLVMQQIEACHNIVGIPQEWTIDMTGLISPSKRASLWNSKRVFFVTPQVLEKDIQSGTCLVKYLVCLVIDEAHRAMGNYSYCVAVRELLAVPVEMRILALTATPGSKQQTIQQVIDNLQISTLEYRNETDLDVCPYVHNRKIELIEVPMGKEAVEINNLLLDVIRPMAARLSSMGLLQNRDFQTLSPCDLLNSRDKFRQAPPPELPHMKYGEVEGYFGVLITLYHIRKLLSSHGIRPAHEMLEEKMQQGYFARLMSRNEAIQRAKLLMQQSLSHGAPSPKLSKMIEILDDHFKTNDPQNSRVIIFSNFRGSVRDILDSLANIGNSVKATQFIGQSSGKTLKGQTQKVQQAVLEKFRMGGYNVIVATSIGEEGLDIMEVDLVICFDANISPLRMIQRMGRTGRKHDGRVVVLACEGTELKGYMRKQATGKTVRKHMRNGGMNSFNFHSSPRMVPHFLKPELRFEELSIEKFVRHPPKVKVNSAQAPTFREKLTDAEAALLKKYFIPIEKISKPSLIAFPHFQAFPSSVHRVMHSSRTGWFIDVMQNLQGLPFSSTRGVDSSRSHCLATGTIEHDESGRDYIEPVCRTCPQKEIFNPQISPSGASVGEDMLDSPSRVFETMVLPPTPPSTKQSVPVSPIENVGRSHLTAGSEMFDAAAGDILITHTLSVDEKYLNEIVGIEAEDAMASKVPTLPAEEYDLAIAVADSDLSPRLTNFIKSGFVPESPLSDTGLQSEGKHDHEQPLPEPISPSRSCDKLLTFADEDVNVTDGPQTTDVKENEVHTPLLKPDDVPSLIQETSESPSSHGFRTPLQNLTNSSCSNDWRISSGEKSRTGERPLRFRRLRKIGDLGKEKSFNSIKEQSTCSAKITSRFTGALSNVRNHSKARRPFEDARDFIDEEAEVSSEDVVPDSEDEGNHEDSDGYEDSFIDDRVEPTAGTSQAEADDQLDMMAVYRRSLLTQSPFRGHLNHSTVNSSPSVGSITTMESGECSGKTCTLQTPQGFVKSPNISAGKNSVCSRLNLKNGARKAFQAPRSIRTSPSTSGNYHVNEDNIDSRKRKMSSNGACTLPPKNLEKDFCFQAGPSSKETPLSYQANGVDANCAILSDDQFYEGLDLDELEAQAVKLLSQKTESMPGRSISEPPPQNVSLLSAPSFDLGIS